MDTFTALLYTIFLTGSLFAGIYCILARGASGAILAIFVSGIAGSPLFYEFPCFFQSSVVVERTATGHFVEHPWGTFCWEGDERFITVPTKNSEMSVNPFAYCALPHNSTKSIQSTGTFIVTDYERLLSHPDDLNTRDMLALKVTMQTIVHDCFQQAISSVRAELETISDPNDPADQERFNRIIDETLNPLLANRGLKYIPKEFWFNS